MKAHTKHVCIDLDDTISVTLNRDWANAVPVQPVIDKLIELKAKGWFITILTARGNLSCPSREAAREQYSPIIIDWLARHNVPYDTLDFNKPLAAYYVDDKAMRPDEFAELDVRPLKGGWSGAEIEYRNNVVYKTYDGCFELAHWNSLAQSVGINTPRIHSVVGRTVAMEYIEATGAIDYNQVMMDIDKLRTVSWKNRDGFHTYIEYISRPEKHFPYDIRQLTKKLTSFDLDRYESFSHGDLSISNIIRNNDVHYYIDPQLHLGVFSSFMLDIGKLYMSVLLMTGSTDAIKVITAAQVQFQAEINPELIKLLAMTHIIRVWKDAPTPEIKQQLGTMWHNLQLEVLSS